MPGVVHSSPPFAADAFQMEKADDDFCFNRIHWTYPGLTPIELGLANRFRTQSFALHWL
jgi:hypothetical protein